MHASHQHQQQLRCPRHLHASPHGRLAAARALPAGRRGGAAAGGARGGVRSSCSGSPVMWPRAPCASAATSPMDVPCGCGSVARRSLSTQPQRGSKSGIKNDCSMTAVPALLPC